MFMLKELNILIVEDVPRDAEAIEAELRSEAISFSARRLETKDAFLTELKNLAPDLVLCDFTLPEFNALEALRLLRENKYDIPFILVTGSRSEEVAVECIREGADDYVLKTSLKRLPSSILNVLRKKAAEREKAKAEAALRRSEEQYRLIAENTRDLISLVDLHGKFIYASPSFRTGLGYEPEELVGSDFLFLVHPNDQEIFQNLWQQALLTKEGRAAEFRAKHRNGEWRIFESVGNWIFDEQGNAQRSVVVSRDITERKQAEETLRGLPRLILKAQEAERRRVARELHDSVNQILCAVKFRLHLTEEKLLARDENIREDTQKTKFLLDKAMQEVRRISRNLRPSELDDLGLAPAIRSLCGEFTQRTGVAIDLSFFELPKNVPAEIELNLYRIIQEALGNIEKHSEATQVALHLCGEDFGIKATIRDNGRGFDPHLARAKTTKTLGMGLVDMKERVALIGGACTFKSAPGEGMELVVQIPLSSRGKSGRKTGEKGQTEKDKVTSGG